MVHAAKLSEGAGATLRLAKAQAARRRLKQSWVDQGDQAGVVEWAQTERGDRLEVVAREVGTKGCKRRPRRWVVERSIAWIGRYRRMSKEDEALLETSERMIWAAFGTTMLRRLVKLQSS